MQTFNAVDGLSQRGCPDHPAAGERVVSGYGDVRCPKCKKLLFWTKPTDPIILKMMDKVDCSHCSEKSSVKLRKVITSSGKDNYCWYCESCEKYALRQSIWLPKLGVRMYVEYMALRWPDKPWPKSLDDIPCIGDYTGENHCLICGDTGVEYNHFMPQLFKNDPDIAPDWERWQEAGAYLCSKHHLMWHDRVAPLHSLASVKAR